MLKICLKKTKNRAFFIQLFLVFLYDCFQTVMVLSSLINAFENEIMFFSEPFQENPKNDDFQNGRLTSDKIVMNNDASPLISKTKHRRIIKMVST